MNLSHLVLILGLAIGALNLRNSRNYEAPDRTTPLPWPAEFDGRPLCRLPLSAMESSFAASFPGAIANFRSGEDQIILRQVDRATRKLHDSATCLKAAGFEISDRKTEIRTGRPWMTYQATKGSVTLQVREQVRSTADPHSTWTDISQWFWHATFQPRSGPWLAVTIIEEQ